MPPLTPTERRLQQIVAARLQADPAQVPLDQAWRDDLGLDSFDLMSIVLEIEQAFAPATLSDQAASELNTLRAVAAYLDKQRPLVL